MTLVKDITAFAIKTGLRQEAILRKIGFDAYEGVLKRSPVDTGRFRGSWRISLLRTDLSVEPEVVGLTTRKDKQPLKSEDPPTGKEKAYARNQLQHARWGMSIHISNNLPYAAILEDGGSDQAPLGVMKQTFDEIVASFDKTVRSVK